jgi:hypothetical protein
MIVPRWKQSHQLFQRFQFRSTKSLPAAGRRILKKIQMTKIRIAEPKALNLFLTFGHLDFGFVSNFDIRISNLSATHLLLRRAGVYAI